MDPIERICRYVYGELPVEALHGALVEMPALEEVLGKTEYHDLVTFDPVTGRENGFRRSTFELFEARLPGVLLKARARRVCQQMLGGEKDVVQGVQEMSLLREERCSRALRACHLECGARIPRQVTTGQLTTVPDFSIFRFFC